MQGLDLIQDFAVLLLAAGVAGLLCKRVGLSVIVGYLVAGIIIVLGTLEQIRCFNRWQPTPPAGVEQLQLPVPLTAGHA